MVKITKKNIDVQFTQACVLQVCYHAEQERVGGDEKKKVGAAIFLPSKLDLVEIFALALCLRGCSSHKWR